MYEGSFTLAGVTCEDALEKNEIYIERDLKTNTSGEPFLAVSERFDREYADGSKDTWIKGKDLMGYVGLESFHSIGDFANPETDRERYMLMRLVDDDMARRLLWNASKNQLYKFLDSESPGIRRRSLSNYQTFREELSTREKFKSAFEDFLLQL